MICQIASNTSHLECLLTILTEQPAGKALIKSNWGLMKTQVILDYSYKQISSAITLRRQNICSLLHDWLAKLSLEPNVCIGRDPIKRVRYTKIPGVYIDEPLTWSKHAEEMTKKITAGISSSKRLRRFASRDVLVSVYNALIMPHFDYCYEVWDSLGVLAERLQKHHNKCAWLIMRYKNEAGQSELALHHLGWSLLS